jgi:hypothetical protein
MSTKNNATMTEQPNNQPDVDDFQERLEDLGLEGHWRDVGERFQKYRQQNAGLEDCLSMALEDYAADEADIDALRREWAREQCRLDDQRHRVVVELPDEVKQSIERRMSMYGESPEDDVEHWLDLALERTEVRMYRELERDEIEE